jgi:hypothetical protein
MKLIVADKPIKAWKIYWAPPGRGRFALYPPTGYSFDILSEGIPSNKAVEAFHSSDRSRPFVNCDCGKCGYHSCRTRQDALHYIFHELCSLRRSDYLLCEVSIWGKIIEGKIGYRSQYCFPTKIVGSIVDFPCCEQVWRMLDDIMIRDEDIIRIRERMYETMIPALKEKYNCQ